MKRTKGLFAAGFLAALLVFMVFALTNSVNAKSGETASAAPLSSRIVPERPGTFLTGPNEGQPLEIALNFIRANRADLQMSEAEVSSLSVKDNYLSQKSGTTHIYLIQTHNGIEVYNTIVNINVAADGSVINVGSSAVPNLTAAIDETAVELTAEQAVEKAAEILGLSLSQSPVVQEVVGGAAEAVVISGSGISSDPIPARLVYQPIADGRVRLAWDLIIHEFSEHNWWNIRLDAATGQELDRNNFFTSDHWGELVKNNNIANYDNDLKVPLSASAVPSSYLVYGMPVESPHYAVPAPPADGRTLEVSPWLDAPNASPLGWHATTATNWTDTQGNNVDARKGATRYDCGAMLECDPPIDLTMSPSTATNRDSALVNLFYWVNIIHDVTYEYGFDEASGNFQNDNFGLGGAGNDRVNANSQLGIVCNAFFGTPPDGSSGTMDMYICPNVIPNRDGSLDNVVIAHEFGHGISNRLTGGPGNVSCLNNAEQMGEGWSDLVGLLLTMEVGDSGSDVRGIGTWLMGQGPNGLGIRNFPYTTNMAANPHTYDDIIGSGSPHYIGEVWASIVWEVVWALTDAHGFNPNFYEDYTTGGNNLAIQLILEGMKLQPCSPGFVSGRDAILLADQNFTGGQNQCYLWTAFAKRGLGESAVQGSSGSVNDNSEAFDVPAICVNPPSIGVSSGQMSGSVQEGAMLTQTLTISNTGSSDLNWSIGEGSFVATGSCGAPGNIAWVEVSPTNGVTGSGNSNDIDVVFDATSLGQGNYSGELCVTSNDPFNLEVVVELSLTVTPSEYLVYLPAVRRLDGSNAGSPLVLLLGGLVLLPAAVLGWHKRQ